MFTGTGIKGVRGSLYAGNDLPGMILSVGSGYLTTSLFPIIQCNPSGIQGDTSQGDEYLDMEILQKLTPDQVKKNYHTWGKTTKNYSLRPKKEILPG